MTELNYGLVIGNFFVMLLINILAEEHIKKYKKYLSLIFIILMGSSIFIFKDKQNLIFNIASGLILGELTYGHFFNKKRKNENSQNLNENK